MTTIKKHERERIFGVAAGLVGDTDFDAGLRIDRFRRADAFTKALMAQEGISKGRAKGAIATAYRRIRVQRRAQQEPENAE